MGNNHEKFGEGGIRTRGTLRYDSLAVSWLRPLIHLTTTGRKYYGFTVALQEKISKKKTIGCKAIEKNQLLKAQILTIDFVLYLFKIPCPLMSLDQSAAP